MSPAPDHPRDVRDVREEALAEVELVELPLEIVRVAAAERVVVVPEVRVEAVDLEPRSRPPRGSAGRNDRLGVELLEELHDHLGLRQPVENRDTAVGRVQLEQPLRTVAEVDLDRLVLDALLGESDPNTRAVRAPRRVDQLHPSSPISAAICSYRSGGRSAGEAAVRIRRRTSSRSAPVRRDTSVGFASSASSSPFDSSP